MRKLYEHSCGSGLNSFGKLTGIPLVLTLAACGGGDGGGSDLNEAAAQYGIQMVNADDVHDLGGTGAGVNVAVVDTGINTSHSEFVGRGVRGTDFTSNNPNGWRQDNVGHGSAVAGVIGAALDGEGMHGVAYDSQLYSYRIDNDSNFNGVTPNSNWVEMVEQHITDDIDFSNNSWGSCHIDDAECRLFYQTSPGFDDVIDAYLEAIDGGDGTVFVWAAGNIGPGENSIDDWDNPSFEAGLPFLESDLESNWLAVVSVDENGRESDFTYRCGLAAEWCVTAPGDEIFTVDADGGYQNISGTSFAAPMVTGVLAILSDLFPSLTGAQLVQRVKVTATYDGLSTFDGLTSDDLSDAEMAKVFGHGLIDALAAQQEIGSLSIPVGSTTEAKSASMSGFAMPKGLSSSGRRTLMKAQVIALDSFDGAAFQRTGADMFVEEEDEFRSIGYATNGPDRNTFLSDVDLDIADNLSFAHVRGPQGVSAASLNFWGEKVGLVKSFEDDRLPTDAVQISLALSETLTLSSSIEYSDITKESGFGIAAALDLGQRTKVMASLSQGTHVEDMTGLSTHNMTLSDVTSYEIGIRHALTGNIELFGHAEMREMDDVAATSTTWGTQDALFGSAVVGAEYSGLDHRLSLGVYQPDQQISGDATIHLATARSRDGRIFYREEAFDASGDGELGLFFAGKWDFLDDGMGELAFQMQQMPGNVRQVNEAAVMVNLRF